MLDLKHPLPFRATAPVFLYCAGSQQFRFDLVRRRWFLTYAHPAPGSTSVTPAELRTEIRVPWLCEDELREAVAANPDSALVRVLLNFAPVLRAAVKPRLRVRALEVMHALCNGFADFGWARWRIEQIAAERPVVDQSGGVPPHIAALVQEVRAELTSGEVTPDLLIGLEELEGAGAA